MMNNKIALENLITIDQIFRKNNIKYWLQDGTLLGYYREKNFIGHDNDIDLGLFFSDIEYKNFIFHEILNSGFELFKIKGNLSDSLLVTFKRNEEKIDLFFYYHKNNKIYHSSFGKDFQIVNYWYDIFDLKEISFLNNIFYVPADEEKFLTTKYGDNWNISNPDWDHIYDPKNAEVTDEYSNIKISKGEFKKWIGLKK